LLAIEDLENMLKEHPNPNAFQKEIREIVEKIYSRVEAKEGGRIGDIVKE